MSRSTYCVWFTLCVLFAAPSCVLAQDPQEPPSTPPSGDADIQERGIMQPPQLSAMVNFAIRITGSGGVEVVTREERFSCPPTCARPIRGGTFIQLTPSNSASFFYQFSQWQGCTGQVVGTTCRMVVPMNAIAAGVGAVFVPIPEHQQALEAQKRQQKPTGDCGDGSVLRLPNELCAQLPRPLK